MKKIFKVIGVIAAAVIVMVLYTNAFPLTIYSKTETETKVYYTYEVFEEWGNVWREIPGVYDEQQPLFTEDNKDTLREIKHTNTTVHKIRYKLKGFEILIIDSGEYPLLD